ncbi:MAG: hypothetical protein IT429_17155, partial [Gemmataceae bacterium]|nr:hypothetical protein [Gemmataceae bacterium]
MAKNRRPLKDKESRRNVLVERAVNKALERVDDFVSGEEVDLPTPAHRRACETLLDTRSASVKTAVLFLVFYWLEDQTWDMNSVPTGARGQFGDKKLCEELTNRSITLHGNITAYGENLGWKGNVSSKTIRLLEDNRFKDFLAQIIDACKTPAEMVKIADYLAQRFAESRREATPLPPVGRDVLTFVRAKVLFHKLVAIPSEGHIQQFLIAALLYEYRRRHSIEITTHHPHAADKYDDTAGDIEERREGQFVRAYEVTVRDDWKNRISRFKTKMDHFHLSKYIIIAAGINTDDEWKVPATMALKLEPYERDIAVVDIYDVIHFLAAELTPQELRAAVNQAHTYLTDRKLSGRPDFIEAYVSAVREWLD